MPEIKSSTKSVPGSMPTRNSEPPPSWPLVSSTLSVRSKAAASSPTSRRPAPCWTCAARWSGWSGRSSQILVMGADRASLALTVIGATRLASSGLGEPLSWRTATACGVGSVRPSVTLAWRSAAASRASVTTSGRSPRLSSPKPSAISRVTLNSCGSSWPDATSAAMSCACGITVNSPLRCVIVTGILLRPGPAVTLGAPWTGTPPCALGATDCTVTRSPVINVMVPAVTEAPGRVVAIVGSFVGSSDENSAGESPQPTRANMSASAVRGTARVWIMGMAPLPESPVPPCPRVLAQMTGWRTSGARAHR